MRCAIVHYHELALKGRNRDFFEQRLVRNLRLALKDLKIRRIESLQGRIRVTIPDEVTPDLVTERLRRTCGVSNFLLTESVPLNLTAPDLTTIKQVAEYLKVTERTIYRLAAAKKIPAFKVGGTWRFSKAEITEWIQQQSKGGKADKT